MNRGADAEAYLRSALQRVSATPAGGSRAWFEPVVTARALVSVELISERRALALLKEHEPSETAAERWSGRASRRVRRALARKAREQVRVPVRRVAVCDLEVPNLPSRMRLQEARFFDDTTVLEFTSETPDNLRLSPDADGFRFSFGSAAGSIHRVGVRGPWSDVIERLMIPYVIDVHDDQSKRAVAALQSWHDNGVAVETSFVTDVPLSVETRSINIANARLELTGPGHSLEARVEPVPELDPLRSMFQREVLDSWRRYTSVSTVQIAVDALVSTGALSIDHPIAVEMTNVANALRTRSGLADLPLPWSRIARRWGRSDGRIGRVAVGAEIDAVDGYWLRVDSLTSRERQFSVSLAASPASPLFEPMDAPLDAPPLQWWAEDDVGNLYLGVKDHATGSPWFATGKVNFSGSLDPTARELRFLPTGRRERGVLSIMLSEAESGG